MSQERAENYVIEFTLVEYDNYSNGNIFIF